MTSKVAEEGYSSGLLFRFLRGGGGMMRGASADQPATTSFGQAPEVRSPEQRHRELRYDALLLSRLRSRWYKKLYAPSACKY